jgi:hypothetical protein
MDAATVAPRGGFFMLDELLEIFERDNDEGDRRDGRGRRAAPARKGGIRGFISRLFGSDGDVEQPPADRADRSYRDRNDDDDEYYDSDQRRRSARRDRDDDDGFDFGD